MVTAGPGRPKGGYFLPDGTRVPGVTTVIGRFKDSGALMHWAWMQGMAKKDYRDTALHAATAGTIAHSMIEADIHGREPQLPTSQNLNITEEEYAELLGKARKAFDAYVEWKSNTRIEIVHTELPLVSAGLRYGGTIDAVGRIGDEYLLLDWKSTGSVYPDHVVQAAAYRGLWNENFPSSPIDKAQVLRVDKIYAAFANFGWPKEILNMGEEAFALLRQLYDLNGVLKKAVGK